MSRPSLILMVVMLLDADLIREALQKAGISLKAAALWMQIDCAQLERQLHGEGHLSHRRLLMLPLIFWQWFSVLAVERYGLPRIVRRAIPIQLAVMGRRRMLRVRQVQQKAKAS